MRENSLFVDVVRHGESTWNAEGKWQGQADPPLSEDGLRQAQALAGRLRTFPWTAIWSSDLARAVETATAVASPKGLDVRQDRDLREMDVGEWAGLTRKEIAERFSDEYTAMQAGEDPHRGGGENRQALMERVRSAFAAIVREAEGEGLERILIVTHGGVAREIALDALGLDVQGMAEVRRLAAPDNTAVSVVAARGDFFRLVSYNDASHVVDLRPTALDA